MMKPSLSALLAVPLLAAVASPSSVSPARADGGVILDNHNIDHCLDGSEKRRRQSVRYRARAGNRGPAAGRAHSGQQLQQQ